MSYKLYTDKVNKFQCSIQVEGTSLEKSQARVILEINDEMAYLFNGKIFENVVCEFELPKLNGILNEGDKGLLKLEVIADDVHFEPWNSEFVVGADKKVNVVVQEQAVSDKPKIVMNEISLTRVEDKPKMENKKPQPVQENKKVIKKPTENSRYLSKEDLLRKLLNKKTPIYAMSIMCEQNYRDLEQFYDFVLNDLQADKLKLNWFDVTLDLVTPNSYIDIHKQNIVIHIHSYT
jgi:hypothetical protein